MTEPSLDTPHGDVSAPVDAIGADTSFHRFFSLHHDTLVRGLTLALGDVELGRDAAAEGFARALPKWGTVGGYDNPAGWVYRVGLNWARSRRRKTLRELDLDAARGRPEPSAEAAEPDLRILPALRRLSLDHRTVIVGKFYLDLSEAELAATLGVRPGTVKSRLSRAIDLLTDILGER